MLGDLGMGGIIASGGSDIFFMGGLPGGNLTELQTSNDTVFSLLNSPFMRINWLPWRLQSRKNMQKCFVLKIVIDYLTHHVRMGYPSMVFSRLIPRRYLENDPMK